MGGSTTVHHQDSEEPSGRTPLPASLVLVVVAAGGVQRDLAPCAPDRSGCSTPERETPDLEVPGPDQR